MLISDNSLLFIHIPKNAGQSIERYFGRKWVPKEKKPSANWPETFSRHTPIKAYAQEADYKKFYSFAIVRNPWDRLVSCYTYELKMAQLGKGLHCPNRQLLASGTPFEDYVKKARFTTVFLRQQVSWISDAQGGLAIDEILRFESLDTDFARLAANRGLPSSTLPHSNRSAHQHYSRYYNKEMIDYVAEIYADDIRQFGYSFHQAE